MKNKFLLTGFFLATALIILQGFFNPAKSDKNGPSAGYTGSPGDGISCINCHTPAHNFSGAASITSNIPPAGYTAGQTYTITASITRTGHSRFGFQVSPQDSTPAGNIRGTCIITNSTTTKLASGSSGYVTHKSSGISGTNSLSWSFNWKAPATGLGPVIFYGAFNATNSNNSENGDSIFLTNYKVYENICTTLTNPSSITGSTTVCQGTSTTYSVPAVTGASGYIWTLPNGWSGTSNTNSIDATPGANGGNVQVEATNGCSTTTPATAAISVTPAPSVTYNSSLGPLCNNVSPISLDGGLPVGGTYSGTGVASGMFDPSLAGVGDFIISYTYSKQGCSATDTSVIMVEACTGINNVGPQFNAQVYPNPFSNEINIALPRQLNGAVIEVYNMQGQVMLQQSINDALIHSVNGATWPAGVYLLKIAESGKVVSLNRFCKAE